MLQVEKYKTGIKIKKSNRGKFTSYCGGNVTSACIAKGKASSNPAIRKRATFAANARKWKHLFGGTLKPSKEETILKKYDQFPKIFGRLFGDVPVSLTTDIMGNSWYEVNIPKNLQMRELLYKKGGKLQ